MRLCRSGRCVLTFLSDLILVHRLIHGRKKETAVRVSFAREIRGDGHVETAEKEIARDECAQAARSEDEEDIAGGADGVRGAA